MRIAVVGGGINGIMSAWELARRGATVELFERGHIMEATSAASTKLLHGGLRYLETGHLGLVRKGLQERAWWIAQAPHLAHPLEILIPVYAAARRSRWQYALGLKLYDALAGRHGLGRSRWLSRGEALASLPGLREEGLAGGYRFVDGQMDDHALGLWAADRAREAGVSIYPQHEVDSLSTDGGLTMTTGENRRYDRVINAAGPWAAALMSRSGIAARHGLGLVRGSHLFIDRAMPMGALVEVPDSRRIGFVLPYQGKTLIGTTEVLQPEAQPALCSEAETLELLKTHNTYFEPALSPEDILSSIAGVRPLLAFNGETAGATREHAVERIERLVVVYGGKWTTSRLLGQDVASIALRPD